MTNRHNPSIWTDATKAIVRTMYPTATWPELLEALAPLSRRQIERLAHQVNVYRPDNGRSIDHTALVAYLLKAAKHADGYTMRGLASTGPYKMCTIEKATNRLITSGAIHRLTISSRNVRYFPDANSAQRYLHRSVTLPVGNKVTHGSRGPAYLPGDPVITPATSWTIAPAPPARPLRTNTHMFSA